MNGVVAPLVGYLFSRARAQREENDKREETPGENDKRRKKRTGARQGRGEQHLRVPRNFNDLLKADAQAAKRERERERRNADSNVKRERLHGRCEDVCRPIASGRESSNLRLE